MNRVEIAIIGAGVIGLSIAAEVSRRTGSLYILERHRSFGRETSSRNSEVIHAGIYYPKDSAKTRTCQEGNRLLYEFCAKEGIPHKKTGKIIIARDRSEVPALEQLYSNAISSGATGLKLINSKAVKSLEPNVKSEGGIYSANTGIIDSHRLMSAYLKAASSRGATIAYNSEVKSIKNVSDGYEVTVSDSESGDFTFLSNKVINCAGLQSDTITGMVGIDIDKADYRLKYSKGQYFKLGLAKSKRVSRLIYPLPKARTEALGIHITPNLSGVVRLGPDHNYINREDAGYDIDEGARDIFYEETARIMPSIEEDDLSPDTAGIRPKLQGPGEPFRDFVIAEESGRGFPGFVNLIGIESPGLTAAPSIARTVSSIL